LKLYNNPNHRENLDPEPELENNETEKQQPRVVEPTLYVNE